MNLQLNGRTALITGGCHGIGFAIAKSLSWEGVIVTPICRHTGFDAMKKETYPLWHNYDILINNVGGGGRWGCGIIEETPEEVWQDVYNKNAMTAVRLTMLVLPYMLSRGWGRVVTISSIYGREGGGAPWFNMAKSAQISLMKTLAMKYKDTGVTFNSVAPGEIAIPDTANETKGGKPEDVANIVAFLCSNLAGHINGACVAVDGGEGRSF